MDSFDAILKKLRKDRNATQKEVSQAIGADQQTLRRYESGERKPDTEMLLRIAKYYNVSADYLLGLSENSTVEPDMKAAVKCTGLSEKSIEKLKGITHFEFDNSVNTENANIIDMFIQSSYFENLISLLLTLYNCSAEGGDIESSKNFEEFTNIGRSNIACKLARSDLKDIMTYICDEFDRRESNEHNSKQK